MQILKDFPINRLGSNFVVAVSREVMAVVMEVVSSEFTAIHLHTQKKLCLRATVSPYSLHVLFFKCDNRCENHSNS